MKGLNRVILMGYLGQDPESRNLASGKVFSSFSVATNRRWKDPSGQLHEETDWHRVVTYDKQAEAVRDYLMKGRPVLVEGRLQTREWKTEDGQKRFITEVVAESVQFLPGGERRSEVPAAERALPAPSAERALPSPANGNGSRRALPRGRDGAEAVDVPF